MNWPDLPQARAHCVRAQIGQANAVRTRVGERRVGGAAAAEFGVQLDNIADINDEQKRRPALLRRQIAGVVLGLGASAQQAVVEAFALRVQPQLLRFQHEGAGSGVGTSSSSHSSRVKLCALASSEPSACCQRDMKASGVMANVGLV